MVTQGRCALGDLLAVYSQLRLFSRVLGLAPFRLRDLMLALSQTEVETTLEREIMMRALKTLTLSLRAVAMDDTRGDSDHALARWLALDVFTWPELLREYAVRGLNAGWAHESEGTRGAALGARVAGHLGASDFFRLAPEHKVEVLRWAAPSPYFVPG